MCHLAFFCWSLLNIVDFSTFRLQMGNRLAWYLFQVDWFICVVLPATFIFIVLISFVILSSSLMYMLTLCDSSHASTTVLIGFIVCCYTVGRHLVKPTLEMCEYADNNLLFKLSTLYISIPLLLCGVSDQFLLLSSINLLDVAECAKTPTMNAIIEALSKKTEQGDIEAIVIANNKANDLNTELNQFKQLRVS